MVLDASKPHAHREILTRELESVGIRLNRHAQLLFAPSMHIVFLKSKK